jgi:hypothetical protein
MQQAAELSETLRTPSGRTQRLAREETPDVTDLRVVRTFRYPGGRIWAVCVIMHPSTGGPPVLQFTAGSRSLDLVDWPKDWADYPDADLVLLLRKASRRDPSSKASPAGLRRRWNDHPEP